MFSVDSIRSMWIKLAQREPFFTIKIDWFDGKSFDQRNEVTWNHFARSYSEESPAGLGAGLPAERTLPRRAGGHRPRHQVHRPGLLRGEASRKYIWSLLLTAWRPYCRGYRGQVLVREHVTVLQITSLHFFIINFNEISQQLNNIE